MTPDQIQEMEMDIAEDRRSGWGRWSWFAVIEKLAGGDLTKFSQVEDMNFITCLNLLSYWKERDRREEEIRRRQIQNK